MRLGRQVALITGAGSGIGKETALLFAREGAQVAVIDLDEDLAAQTAADIVNSGGSAIAVQADVTNAKAIEAAVVKVISIFERIDILFNNAGIGCVGALHDIDEDLWDRVMAVNIKGV